MSGRDGAERWRSVTTAAVVVALMLAIAFAGTREPLMFIAVAGLVAATGLSVATATWPRHALAVAPVLVVLSATKFRIRDADATLGGALDAQVTFELLCYGLIVAIVAGALLSGRVRLPGITGVELSLVGFAGLAVASAAWSYAPALTVVRAVQLIVLLLLAMVMLQALGLRAAIRTAGFSLAGSVLLLSALAAAMPATRIDPDRFSWFAVHPIAAATLAGVAAIFMLSEVASRRSSGGSRLFGAAVLVLLVAVLTLTQSRGPMVAFLCGAGILITQRYLRAWHLYALAGTGVLGVIAYLSSTWGLLDLFSKGARVPTLAFFYRGQSVDRMLGLNGRLELWQQLAEFIADQPLVGYGYHGSRALILQLFPWAAYAHNALLQTVLDTGVIGVVLFWGAIVAVIIRWMVAGGLRDRQAEHVSCALAMLVFLVVGSMANESFSAAPGYELLLVLVCIIAVRRAGSRPPRHAPGARPARPATAGRPVGAAWMAVPPTRGVYTPVRGHAPRIPIGAADSG